MKEIKNILICGAGMMGKNIGYVFASNPSFQVGMYDLCLLYTLTLPTNSRV